MGEKHWDVYSLLTRIQLKDALVEALTAEGDQPPGFRTGETALEALQTQEFDLLLTDLMMPGMDGITLLKAGLAIDQNRGYDHDRPGRVQPHWRP